MLWNVRIQQGMTDDECAGVKGRGEPKIGGLKKPGGRNKQPAKIEQRRKGRVVERGERLYCDQHPSKGRAAPIQ